MRDMYHKARLLEMAIDLLEKESKIHLKNVETVDVDSTTYDDGSSSLTITVNRPAKHKAPFESLVNFLTQDEEPEYDQQEAIEFIRDAIRADYAHLIEVPKADYVKFILDYEEDYMRSKGIIED